MLRLSVRGEGADMQPAVVGRIASRPDNGSHASLREIELEKRMGHAFGIGQHFARLRFFRKVQAISSDIRVRRVEQRQIVFVTAGEVGCKIRLEGDDAALERFRQAGEYDALLGKRPEVDGMAATGT